MKKATIGIAAILAILLVITIAVSITITGGITGVKANPGCEDNPDDYYYYDPIWMGNLSIGQDCNGIGECGERQCRELDICDTGIVECSTTNPDAATCSTNPDGSNPQNQSEICDGLDNNCNDETDEIFTYYDPIWMGNLSIGQDCNGIGECGERQCRELDICDIGTVECKNLTTASCWTNPGCTHDESIDEICNGLDDDCNGLIDDNCAATISITIHGYPIDFGPLNPGTTGNPALGNSSYIIRVELDTTVNVDLYQKGDSFTSGGNSFDIGNMRWSTTDNFNSSFPMNGSYNSSPIATNVEKDTNIAVYYWLNIPSGKTAGDYNATIDIKAVETGTAP